MTCTCARECGSGTMTVRGMGVRVLMTVDTHCNDYNRHWCASTDGGEATAERARPLYEPRTMGFVMYAPDGATETQNN